MTKFSSAKKAKLPKRRLPVIRKSAVQERLMKTISVQWMDSGQAAVEDLLEKLQTDKNLQASMQQVLLLLAQTKEPQDKDERLLELSAFPERIKKIAKMLQPHLPLQHITGYGGGADVVQFDSSLKVNNPEDPPQGLEIRLQLRGQQMVSERDFSLSPYGLKLWVNQQTDLQSYPESYPNGSYFFIHMDWKDGYMAFMWDHTSYTFQFKLD